ncbi:hypothetical protein K458DRAFT_396040 [Lentithecium fluviatile CBS 122367]|uniref:F-box domain-containing protein n=1 Tax=Lentithecium fluviatile CBS 122367 TaxID=1168545 RepID=A0A6G1IHB7_9PLEO|nr:hypothetical protein K458DRAFT_396040 [Lentithecium fluviatile CBS 122367]
MPETILSTLPTELLLEIAVYLPIPSAAALALTCRRMYAMLDDYKWTDFKARETSVYENLLELIQRDDPRWTFCKSCQSIHSTKDSLRLSELDLAAKLEQTDSYDDDMKCIGLIYGPRIPGKTGKPEVLLEVLRAHVRLVELRGFRYDPNGLRNKGLCLDLLSINETRILSLPALDDLESIDATINYSTAPKLNQGNTNLMLQTTVRATLSSALVDRGDTSILNHDKEDRFRQLRRVLQLLNVQCCLHCSPAQMSNEIVCKLSQYMLFSSECGCSQWQPERICKHHQRHNCYCISEVIVSPMGADCVEVVMWQEWPHWSLVAKVSPKRGTVRRKYLGQPSGNTVTVNARWSIS